MNKSRAGTTIVTLVAGLMLSGCVVSTVVGTAVDVTTTAVGTAVDVTAGAVGATADVIVGDDDN